LPFTSSKLTLSALNTKTFSAVTWSIIRYHP
jgi:hypothetical protein